MFVFDEKNYLKNNPDVRRALSGTNYSATEHFFELGQFESRVGTPAAFSQNSSTRLCFDPWNYIGINPNGQVVPCCIRPTIGRLGAESEEIKRKRFELMGQLLTGQLDIHCKGCHIKDKTDRKNFVEQLKNKFGSMALTERLNEIRIDITTNCNLRCVYCAVSNPDYQGKHMDSEMIVDVYDYLESINPDVRKEIIIHVNGHGETTCHPDWLNIVEKILSMGFKWVRMITNLARHYTDEEFETLSKLESVQLSIDTADSELLKTIRRKVDLNTFIHNIIRIKIAAVSQRREPPILTFSCGVYDKNYKTLDGLVDLAIVLGVKGFTFWDLVVHESFGQKVNPISSLPREQILEVIEILEGVAERLEKHEMDGLFAGDFLEGYKKIFRRIESFH